MTQPALSAVDLLGLAIAAVAVWLTRLPANQQGFKVLMPGKRNCYDNAVVEAFFKTIKAELTWR